jgi:hypothetical protein
MLRAAVSSRLSFFFLRRSFSARALTRTNEVASDEYSGSWLNLSPAFTAACANDWRLGNRIQLQQRNCSRMFTGFLAPIH